jgi:hypothetical protein
MLESGMKTLTMFAIALSLVACGSDQAPEAEEREFTPEMAEARALDDQEMERRALEREAQREAESAPE